MINAIIEAIFGCTHRRTTFPITPRSQGRASQFRKRQRTYIVCLDCGKEFDYNWKEMRVGGDQAANLAKRGAGK